MCDFCEKKILVDDVLWGFVFLPWDDEVTVSYHLWVGDTCVFLFGVASVLSFGNGIELHDLLRRGGDGAVRRRIRGFFFWVVVVRLVSLMALGKLVVGRGGVSMPGLFLRKAVKKGKNQRGEKPVG